MEIHRTKNVIAISLLIVAIFLILNYIVNSNPLGDWGLPLLLLLIAGLLSFVVGRPRAAAEAPAPAAESEPRVREFLLTDSAPAAAAPVIAAPTQAVLVAAPVAAVEPAPVVEAIVEPVAAEASSSAPEPAPIVEAPVAEPAPTVEPVVAAYSAPAEPAAEAKPKSRGKKETTTTIVADNLQRIEGIGPKMAKALNSAGIETFAQLAAADEGALRAAIEAGGLRFAPSLATWAKQAQFLADGDEIGFQTYVDSLTSGRA